MTRVPAPGERSQAQVTRARSGTRPGPPAPQIRNFLSPRDFPAARRHNGAVAPPDPRQYLTGVPLQGLQRYSGEVTVRLWRGQAQDRERRGRTPLPQSVGAQSTGLSAPTSPRRELETGRVAGLPSAPADHESALRRFGSGYVIELMSRSTWASDLRLRSRFAIVRVAEHQLGLGR
jgi:hypothetical protein